MEILTALQEAQEKLAVQNEELNASNIELRQIQEDLEASRRKYADLYDVAPVGYCTFDENGVILEANLTIAELLGVERDHLLHSRFYHFIVEEDRDNFYLHLRTLLATQTRQMCELRLMQRDGVQFYAQLDTIVAQEDAGQPSQYRTAISNITPRKLLDAELQTYRQHLEDLVEARTAELRRTNEQLQQEITGRHRSDQSVRASEQQYRLLAESVADGIGIIQAGKLVFVNHALSAMLRYSTHHLIGMDIGELVRPDVQEGFRKRFEQIEQDLIPQDWQAACVTGDGGEVWTEFRQRVIEWEGKPAILATVRDITARKLRETAIEEERAHLRRENLQLRSAIEDRSRFGDFVGKSSAMQAVYAQIVTAAAVDANVLIAGESGTGKELAAQTIHKISQRKTHEFVAVNCGAISENLFEREFFGHRKGAFTGADKDQPGFFDRAHKGTLFLDEVGELNPTMQVKLLRVIETGEYTPVGDNRSRHVDVRLIAATNKNLETLVRQGVMREDFFYRIYVLTITMPPLREHREDIPLLIEHFWHIIGKGAPRPKIPERIIETLSQKDWPGNIRELYNVLQRYLQEHRLTFSDTRRTEPVESTISPSQEFDLKGLTFSEAVEAFEKRMIANALEQHVGNIGAAAKSLGLPLRTLYRKIEKYRLA
ncbi:PAS modulated sigma54 specific transcriptional regulator, Fis family [Candidatus Moduliflexus flocculans]|uniref:PAS modulated sigma54 specific transcriptional regulator, Fis family n=1 Tax=Candidatus Moduliflexus flocculans TaxID=1499966 RepID=A0A0S6W0B4_9BACT|nr:PAS modulated sigma54 specific transcriptional regulator, Fis family [Candidatus Moduliflexus flocculans]